MRTSDSRHGGFSSAKPIGAWYSAGPMARIRSGGCQVAQSTEADYGDSQWWPISLRSAGMQAPPDPARDADPFAIVWHYIAWYEKEFSRLRKISRTRVDRVITFIAALNALIAVLGVASAAWKYPWFGISSTALAGISGVVAAKNNLFRDQELWQLRSSILAQLQHLKREIQYRRAVGENLLQVAADSMGRLNEILDKDLQGWSGVNRSVLDLGHENELPPS
ncbi:SLATT domain-containing protein [Streptomyces sp. NPDC048179]|uniref:SLATT domain-containing protein n=1 Tax=Streptomyces sp. NPDC048179 TaxID=3365506 RepID=UPI00371F81F5